MCIQVVERYAVCGCLYYKHQVDVCPKSRKRSHEVRTREVFVGYSCPQHSSSAFYRQPSARPRRQAREEYQSDTPSRVDRSESLDNSQYETYFRPATGHSDNGQVTGSDAPFAGASFDAHISSWADIPWAAPVSYLTDRHDPDRAVPWWPPPIDVGDHGQGVVDNPEFGEYFPFRSGNIGQEVDRFPAFRDFPYCGSGDVGQEVGDTPDIGGFHYDESEVQTLPDWTAPSREIESRGTPPPGENTCPHHLLQSVAACPRECGWNVEQTIERADATTEISSRRLHHLLRDSLTFAIANLSRSIGPTAVAQPRDPCRGINSYTITDTLQLDALHNGANPDASTRSTSQLPTANSDIVNEAEYPSTATCHKKKTKKRPSIPPCYLLIVLGLLTVIGSLLPGLWQASSRNDLSGGFTLAQYILGVGIFVVGSMVAIHSKTCECWKTHKPVDQVVGAGH